jgi:AcrR family transcriptional regulator
VPRPSRNIDQLLLDAGLDLLPATGCRGLSARMLAEHAGVNLGMFHYHFRSKDNFIRALLDRMYEQMFSVLVIKAAESRSALANLRNALQVLASFACRNQKVLLRIVADAMGGEALALEFLHANVPRHVGVLAGLIADAQRAGHIVEIPLPQALAFIGGSVLAPVLLGGAVLEQGRLAKASGRSLEREVLSERALQQRIEFALRGLKPVRRRQA